MNTSITKHITTIVLVKTLELVAWPMCRARNDGAMSSYAFVARFWEYVGGIGGALEAGVDRSLVRRRFDFGTYRG